MKKEEIKTGEDVINFLRNKTEFETAVLAATFKIPKGKVSTYKGIAKKIGRPRAYRAVGNALHKNPLAPIVPCHRVVRSDGRFGYGSHSFLNEYIRRNSCKRIMEIGVADGENAREMVIVASRNSSAEEVEYYGFDTFTEKDDSQIKLVRQKLKKTGCKFRLFKGNSVKTLPRIVRNLPMMDLIFIDGGHSYTTVKIDWENSKSLMHNETAVFFHNYNFSGPKKVVDNISREECRVKIIDPPSDCKTAFVRKKI